MSKYFCKDPSLPCHRTNAKRLRAQLCSWEQLEYRAIASELIYIAADCWLTDDQALAFRAESAPVVFTVDKNIPNGPLLSVIERVFDMPSTAPSNASIALVQYRATEDQAHPHPRPPKRAPAPVFAPLQAECYTEARSEIFRSKSQALRFFSGLTSAKIDHGVSFTYSEWRADPHRCLARLHALRYDTLIVRSSASTEDTSFTSNAGAYTSVSNVPNRTAELHDAIECVFGSYRPLVSYDEVLVQRQIVDVSYSGVCTTRVVGKGTPYYIINYDAFSGSTSSVTAGATEALEALVVYREAPDLPVQIPAPLQAVLSCVREIETLIGPLPLDVEFAVEANATVHVFQVRPLIAHTSSERDAAMADVIRETAIHLERAFEAKPTQLPGTRTLLGVMPDANPAELIGMKPKPLAYSLYSYLITDTLVAEQRMRYGYRDVRPAPHMHLFAGTPYVDVRTSFNSFIPASLSYDDAARLSDAYVDRLASKPALHDKVEFDVVATTWFPGIESWLDARYQSRIPPDLRNKLVVALQHIFLNAVDNLPIESAKVLQYEPSLADTLRGDQSDLAKANRLLEICRTKGCPPFVHLARSGFVAVTVLKGLKDIGVLTHDDYHRYLHSVDSVSSTMDADAWSVKSGRMDIETFVEQYKHLRPGTYEIAIPSYGEDISRYLMPWIENATEPERPAAPLNDDTKARITEYFISQGMNLSYDVFDSFARQAIRGREFAKFQYTKFMSNALQLLISWAGTRGIERDWLSYATVHDLRTLTTDHANRAIGQWRRQLEARRTAYEVTSLIETPDLMAEPSDLIVFTRSANRPNYITRGAVNAKIVPLDDAGSTLVDKTHLSGKLILISSADPGFDWLFGCDIAGLITKYGGANSHMAIRCAEMNLPAAIGVGEKLYQDIRSWNEMFLDCAAETMREA